MLDADAVALEAVRVNVPEATTHLSDGWPSSTDECTGFDWVSIYMRICSLTACVQIVSNPPVHRGKAQVSQHCCQLLGPPTLLQMNYSSCTTAWFFHIAANEFRCALIVSVQDFSVLSELAFGAAERLAAAGTLYLVAQVRNRMTEAMIEMLIA